MSMVVPELPLVFKMPKAKKKRPLTLDSLVDREVTGQEKIAETQQLFLCIVHSTC